MPPFQKRSGFLPSGFLSVWRLFVGIPAGRFRPAPAGARFGSILNTVRKAGARGQEATALFCGTSPAVRLAPVLRLCLTYSAKMDSSFQCLIYPENLR